MLSKDFYFHNTNRNIIIIFTLYAFVSDAHYLCKLFGISKIVEVYAFIVNVKQQNVHF